MLGGMDKLVCPCETVYIFSDTCPMTGYGDWMNRMFK